MSSSVSSWSGLSSVAVADVDDDVAVTVAENGGSAVDDMEVNFNRFNWNLWLNFDEFFPKFVKNFVCVKLSVCGFVVWVWDNFERFLIFEDCYPIRSVQLDTL